MTDQKREQRTSEAPHVGRMPSPPYCGCKIDGDHPRCCRLGVGHFGGCNPHPTSAVFAEQRSNEALAETLVELSSAGIDDAERAALGSLSVDPFPTFEQAWAKMAAEGYQYGADALEHVHFGWQIHEAICEQRDARSKDHLLDKASPEDVIEGFREQARALARTYQTGASSISAIAALLLNAFKRGQCADYPKALLAATHEVIEAANNEVFGNRFAAYLKRLENAMVAARLRESTDPCFDSAFFIWKGQRIMATREREPAQPVMRECEHCGGDGEVEVYCFDCGDELFTDSVASPDGKHNSGGDPICTKCLDNRREDMEAAEAIATLPLSDDERAK